MNKDDLKNEVEPMLSSLDTLGHRLIELAANGFKTLNTPNLTGTNITVMQNCIDLLGDKFAGCLGPKALPLVNKVHRAYWKNARYNMEQARQDEESQLMARAPKIYLPKKKKELQEAEVEENLIECNDIDGNL